MFNREDNTYNEIREKSLFQWLDEMEKHEDIAVRGGVKLTREYIQHLKDENKRLEEQNKLANIRIVFNHLSCPVSAAC